MKTLLFRARFLIILLVLFSVMSLSCMGSYDNKDENTDSAGAITNPWGGINEPGGNDPDPGGNGCAKANSETNRSNKTSKLEQGKPKQITVDPSKPPDMLYVSLKGDCEYFSLFKESRRGPDFEIIKLFEDGSEQYITPDYVRTYMGYSLTDRKSLMAATLLPNGDLRYQIFRGNSDDVIGNPTSASVEYIFKNQNVTYYDSAPTSSAPVTALGSFTNSNTSLQSWLADISVIVDKSFFDELGYKHISTLLEKIETSINFTDALYVRDMQVSHPIDKVIIKDWADASNWFNTKSLVDQYFPQNISKHFVTVTSWGGGLAGVCSNHSVNAFYNSYNQGYGEFWHVFRHEIGHNHGANHYEGGSSSDKPEGSTIMSDNEIYLSRMSGPEHDAMQSCLQRSFSSVYRHNTYKPRYPVTPYAKYDHVIIQEDDAEIIIDVLANDHDANGDRIAIAAFDEYPESGGQVRLSSLSGPNQRDQLIYQPGRDFPWGESQKRTFSYSIFDETGRLSTGTVAVQMQPYSITINSDSKIRALENNAAALAVYYEQYGELILITSNGHWTSNIVLPNGSSIEGKKFTLQVHSSYSVKVHFNGSVSSISQGNSLSLIFSNGKWMQQ